MQPAKESRGGKGGRASALHEIPDSSLPSYSLAFPRHGSQCVPPSLLRLILITFPSLTTKIVLSNMCPSSCTWLTRGHER